MGNIQTKLLIEFVHEVLYYDLRAAGSVERAI